MSFWYHSLHVKSQYQKTLLCPHILLLISNILKVVDTIINASDFSSFNRLTVNSKQGRFVIGGYNGGACIEEPLKSPSRFKKICYNLYDYMKYL